MKLHVVLVLVLAAAACEGYPQRRQSPLAMGMRFLNNIRDNISNTFQGFFGGGPNTQVKEAPPTQPFQQQLVPRPQTFPQRPREPTIPTTTPPSSFFTVVHEAHDNHEVSTAFPDIQGFTDESFKPSTFFTGHSPFQGTVEEEELPFAEVVQGRPSPEFGPPRPPSFLSTDDPEAQRFHTTGGDSQFRDAPLDTSIPFGNSASFTLGHIPTPLKEERNILGQPPQHHVAAQPLEQFNPQSIVHRPQPTQQPIVHRPQPTQQPIVHRPQPTQQPTFQPFVHRPQPTVQPSPQQKPISHVVKLKPTFIKESPFPHKDITKVTKHSFGFTPSAVKTIQPSVETPVTAFIQTQEPHQPTGLFHETPQPQTPSITFNQTPQPVSTTFHQTPQPPTPAFQQTIQPQPPTTAFQPLPLAPAFPEQQARDVRPQREIPKKTVSALKVGNGHINTGTKMTLVRSNNEDGSQATKIEGYEFGYGVLDGDTGNQYYHAEKREEGTTKGSYKIQLADGRIQTVTYVADKNGFQPKITYEGEARYPQTEE